MEKRKRDRDEYQRERYLMKKDRKMEKKEKRWRSTIWGRRMLRYSLAPSSSSDASPSFPSFAPSHEVEDEEQPRYAVGDILLLEANTNGRG